MGKLVKWIIVTIGVTAFTRWLRRRRAEPEIAAPHETPNDPADELRRKLAESRETDEAEDDPETPAATVHERRADVHEQGRAALDEMKPTDES